MNYSLEKYFEMTPAELLKCLTEEFMFEIPLVLETPEDLVKAGEMLSKTSSQYSFLSALSSYAKIDCRLKKRENNKEEAEDAIDRKEIIGNMLNAVRMRYNAISRLITVKQESNRELTMVC